MPPGPGGVGGGGLGPQTVYESGAPFDERTSGLEGQYASIGDIELPRRGREFLFTAPRGDVEISAQPFSESLLERGGRFALLAVVALVLLGLVAAARSLLPHLGLWWLGGGLVVLAIAALIFQFLPYLALALLALGVAILIAAGIRAYRTRPAQL
jgi:hypothetical protein